MFSSANFFVVQRMFSKELVNPNTTQLWLLYVAHTDSKLLRQYNLPVKGLPIPALQNLVRFYSILVCLKASMTCMRNMRL